MGLWEGPTSEQSAKLKKVEIGVICEQNHIALQSDLQRYPRKGTQTQFRRNQGDRTSKVHFYLNSPQISPCSGA
jgi:hypothetical protein